MRINQKKAKIGDFLKRIKRPIELEDDKEYKLVTIKLHHNGVTLRGMKKGSEIKSKMYEVKAGDFILSGIDARNGAFGIVPEELDGAIVTNDFWYFDIDENIIDKHFFLELTATEWFDEICKKGSDGTTQRIRLQKDKFFNQTINLPDRSEQDKLLTVFKSRKKLTEKLGARINNNLELIPLLRQQILQDAITGKLSEKWRKENPNIESAEILLGKIKAEKEKLVKEGKIKKQKTLPPITEEKKPFELPEGWVWCRLGDIGLFERGKSKHRPRNDTSLFQNGIYPFVQTGDVARSKNNGYQIKTYEKCYNEKGLRQSRLWDKGTLCITIAANIAETGFLSMKACFPDSVVGFTSLVEGDLSNYVRYFIDATQNEIQRFAPATAQKNINLGIINQLIFPLPPLKEVDYITTHVEQLFSKIDQIKEINIANQTNTDTLNQIILKGMFEK